MRYWYKILECTTNMPPKSKVKSPRWEHAFKIFLTPTHTKSIKNMKGTRTLFPQGVTIWEMDLQKYALINEICSRTTNLGNGLYPWKQCQSVHTQTSALWLKPRINTSSWITKEVRPISPHQPSSHFSLSLLYLKGGFTRLGFICTFLLSKFIWNLDKKHFNLFASFYHNLGIWKVEGCFF